MERKVIRVVDEASFRTCVFGGDGFIEHHPELLESGIEVFLSQDGFWYVLDERIDYGSGNCAFFSQEELDKYLDVL